MRRQSILICSWILCAFYAFASSPYAPEEYLSLRRKIGAGQYQSAREECLRMMDRYPHDAILHETFVEISLYADQLEEAETTLRRRLAAGSSVEQCLYGIGLSRYHRHMYKDALDAFTRSIKVGNRSPDCYIYFSYTMEKVFGIDEAVRMLSLLSHEESSNAYIWYSLGLAYWTKQDFSESAKALNEAVAREPQQMSFQYSLHAVLAIAGRLQDPIRDFYRLLRQAENSGNIFDVQFIRSYILMFLSERGDKQHWNSLVMRAEADAREYGLARWMGWIHARLADDALQRGNLPKAIIEARTAIENSRLSRQSDFMYTASVTENLAHTFRGEYGAALNVVRKLFDLVNLKIEKADTAKVIIQAGWILNELHRPEMALDLIVDGIERTNRQKMDPSVLFFAESILGTVYENLKDTLSAFRTFELASQSMTKSGFRMKNLPVAAGNLARQYLRNGNLKKAIKLIKIEDSLSRASDSRIELANALLNQAELFRLTKRNAESLSCLRGSDAISRELGLLPVQIEAKRMMSELLSFQGKMREAFSVNEQLATLMDTLTCRIPPFLLGADASDFDIWRQLASFEIRQENVDKALAWFEKSRFVARSRVLSYSFLSQRAAVMQNQDLERSLRELTWAPSRRESFDLSTPREKIKWIVKFLDNGARVSEFWVSNQCGRRFLSLDKSPTVRELKSALAADQALVVLSNTDEMLTTISITRDTVITEQVNMPISELQRIVSSLNPTLGSLTGKGLKPDYPPQIGNLSSDYLLYKLIFQSKLRVLDMKFHWIIVPDGALCAIPFEALKDSSGHLVIESHAVSYQLSLNDVIAGNNSNTNQSEDMLFVGNDEDDSSQSLVFDNRYLPIPKEYLNHKLPGIEQERTEIQHSLGHTIDMLSGGAATKNRILSLSPGYGIVHIATHGKPDPKDPILSELAFSMEPTHSERNSAGITPLDVAGHQWHTSLVFLNACGTADGNNGSGPDGFVTAFRCSGAACVVASLGDVGDALSVRLVGEFYSGLSEGLTVDEALRKAKLSLILRGAGFKSWSQLLVYGSTSPIREITSRRTVGPWDSLSKVFLLSYTITLALALRMYRLQSKKIKGRKEVSQRKWIERKGEQEYNDA